MRAEARKMTKRERILDLIRIAGCENEHRTALRLYVENRIGFEAYQEAFDRGRRQCARPEGSRP